MLAQHLGRDPAGHHVARGELGGRVDVGHEPRGRRCRSAWPLPRGPPRRSGSCPVRPTRSGGTGRTPGPPPPPRRAGRGRPRHRWRPQDSWCAGRAGRRRRWPGPRRPPRARCRPAAVRRPLGRRPAGRRRPWCGAAAARPPRPPAASARSRSPRRWRRRARAGSGGARGRPPGRGPGAPSAVVSKSTPALGELAHRGRTALAQHRRRGHVAQSGAGHQGVGDVAGRACPRST